MTKLRGNNSNRARWKRSFVIDSMIAIAAVAAFGLIYQSLISLHWIYQCALNRKESYLSFNDHEQIESIGLAEKQNILLETLAA